MDKGGDRGSGTGPSGPANLAAPADFRLADLLDCLGRWARSAQFCQGLNPAQWESLRFLARANRPSRTPSGLAKYLGTTRGTVSQTVQALEKKGLVTRVADRRDGRVVYLELTDGGRTLLDNDPLQYLDDVLTAQIGPETTASINGHLAQVMACFQSAAIGQSFGTCEYCNNYADPAHGETSHCKLKSGDFSIDDAAGLCVNFAARPTSPAGPD